jgi:hypothetical protein
MITLKFKLIGFIFAVLSSLCLFACGEDRIEEEVEEEMPMSTLVAHLDIKVTKCIDAACSDRIPLPGADITLYENIEDRGNFINEVRKGMSNVEGRAVFNNLQIGCAFIRAEDADIEILEKENTPVNSTSYMEIIFPVE